MNTVVTMVAAFLVVLSPLLGAAVVVRVARWIGTRPGRHRRRRSWPGHTGAQDPGGRTPANGEDPHLERNVSEG